MSDLGGITTDLFLGGALKLQQPKTGYRAGTDPVFLAAAVPAQPGDSVLELGCGVGAALLCLGARVPDLDLVGVEIQRQYADLAAQNAALNDLSTKVVHSDIRTLPDDLRQRNFAHVLANPPYFDAYGHTGPADETKAIAHLADGNTVKDWMDCAFARLRPKGYLTLIHRMEALPQVLRHIDTRSGDIRVWPLVSRIGRAANRFVLNARKGARGRFRLMPSKVVHEARGTSSRNDDFTPWANGVLKDGMPFESERSP